MRRTALLTKPLSEHPLLRTLGKWTWICLTNIGSFPLTLRGDYAKDGERDGVEERVRIELSLEFDKHRRELTII